MNVELESETVLVLDESPAVHRTLSLRSRRRHGARRRAKRFSQSCYEIYDRYDTLIFQGCVDRHAPTQLLIPIARWQHAPPGLPSQERV